MASHGAVHGNGTWWRISYFDILKPQLECWANGGIVNTDQWQFLKTRDIGHDQVALKTLEINWLSIQQCSKSKKKQSS